MPIGCYHALPSHSHTNIYLCRPSLPISRQGQLRRAALYVVTLTLSMFLMLVFMTYNAWLIAAVLLGAGTGHYLFNRDLGLGVLSEDKAVCH